MAWGITNGIIFRADAAKLAADFTPSDSKIGHICVSGGFKPVKMEVPSAINEYFPMWWGSKDSMEIICFSLKAVRKIFIVNVDQDRFPQDSTYVVAGGVKGGFIVSVRPN